MERNTIVPLENIHHTKLVVQGVTLLDAFRRAWCESWDTDYKD